MDNDRWNIDMAELLRPGAPDMIRAAPGAASTAVDGDLAANLARMRQMVASRPDPGFDCIVCTPEGAARLRLALSADAAANPDGLLAGIPVHTEPTREEAMARCLLLREQGKRPALLEGGEG